MVSHQIWIVGLVAAFSCVVSGYAEVIVQQGTDCPYTGAGCQLETTGAIGSADTPSTDAQVQQGYSVDNGTSTTEQPTRVNQRAEEAGSVVILEGSRLSDGDTVIMLPGNTVVIGGDAGNSAKRARERAARNQERGEVTPPQANDDDTKTTVIIGGVVVQSDRSATGSGLDSGKSCVTIGVVGPADGICD